MNFLPENYEAPKSANQNYFKPQDGENRIRILSKPVMGWEDWKTEENGKKKPLRFRINEKPVKPLDSKKPLKHFWAMIIWNVLTEQIQIFHVTQATIKSSLENLCKDSDWGSPFDYDIKINKKGEGIETEYTVLAVPHKPAPSTALTAFREKPINLDAILVDADPFSPEWKSYTPLMPDADEAKIQPINQQLMGERVKPLDIEKISHEQFIELSQLKSECSKGLQKGFDEFLMKGYGVILCDLLAKDYQVVKDKLILRALENKNPKEALEAEMSNKGN